MDNGSERGLTAPESSNILRNEPERLAASVAACQTDMLLASRGGWSR